MQYLLNNIFCYHYFLIVHKAQRMQLLIMLVKRLLKNQQMRVKEMVKRRKEELQVKKCCWAKFDNDDNLPTDPLMPDLEDTTDLLNTSIFSGAYDDDDEGVEADLNYLETTMNVSPIPTIRIHKDHPKDQIIGDINSATQTRKMTKISEEHAMMDVKSAFLYGTIIKEVYVCQPPSFEDPQFHDKVYKVEKALYGLHQAPRAWYKTMSTYLLENRFRRGTIDKTLCIKKDKDDAQEIPNEFYGGAYFLFRVANSKHSNKTNKALLKDEEAEDVDVHLYRSMIGSLMYLTASRPNIMFAVCACACARFQVTPKVSHLLIVKRIFRYLKGQPKLGLWYPKDSPFDLDAFSDSNYARASLDRKSTTGVVEGEGSGQLSEPQPPPSTAPPSQEEQVPALATSHKQNNQTPRQAKIGRETEIPLVKVATILLLSLDAKAWDSGLVHLQEIRVWIRRCIKQGRNLKSGQMFEEGDFDDDIGDMVNESMENVEGDTINAAGAVNTATTGVSVASASITTAGVSISTAEPRTPPTTTITAFEDKDLTIAQTFVKMRSKKAKVKGVDFKDVEESARSTTILPTIDPKDKGKGIMQEPEKPPQRTLIRLRFKGMQRLLKDCLKKNKHNSEVVKDSRKEDDAEKEDLRAYLDIIPRDDEAINVESLAIKYPIVDWKTHALSEGKIYYEIIRGDGSTKFYKIFTEMLNDFDRQDVLDLYRLVKERFETASPEGYDRLL
ncbi:putative ribonuclease H-like domain-containing protein [Tanacetum coccineum]